MGEDVAKVILTFDDYASKKNRFGEEIGTSGSASFFIYADNFTAEQITFQNSAGPVGQAVAVRVASDRVRFINCKFLGFQDTLYTYGNGAASRQYYRDCYIEGTTDFIFGAATAVFDRCRIYGKKAGSILPLPARRIRRSTVMCLSGAIFPVTQGRRPTTWAAPGNPRPVRFL